VNEEISREAKELADNISNDIKNASTRIEHIRLTQLALEAERLSKKIDGYLFDGEPPS
jgi:hypothetical protein